MARCPKCGTGVPVPQRVWTMAGRPDRSGFRTVLSVGLFNCPSCGRTFREVLRKTREPATGTSQHQIACWNCRQPNAEDRAYCSFCGASLNREGKPV